MDSVFSTAQYTSGIEKNRAGVIYALTSFVLASYTFYAFTVPQWPVDGEMDTLFNAVMRTGFDNITSLLFLTLYVMCAVALWATREGRLDLGAWALLAAWYAAGVWLNIYAQDTLESTGIAFIQFLLLGALLQRERGLYLTTGIGLVTLVAGYVVRGGVDAFEDVLLMAINLFTAGLVLWLFLRFFRLSLATGVTEALRDQSSINQVVERIRRYSTEQHPMPEVLHEMSRQFVNTFDFIQHARIYLVDAERAEASLLGDSSQPTLSEEKRTRFGVGGLSNVGQATLRGEAIIPRQEGTRTAEGVFPIRMVDDQGVTQIIGALEVRAENRIGRLHNTETQSVIQSICDQFAQIIQTVRRIDGLEQRARTGDALLEQVRSQLQESQRLTQRMTSSVWAQYVRDIEQGAGLSVDFERDVVEANTDWTPTLTEARRINHLVQEQRDDIQVIAMPLRVRGQVVGAMEFELDNQRDFTPEDLELLQEVSERFGLAAENSRLLEDTRRAAQREALVNQIAARLQSTTSVNATLLEAARSLREAIKANKVAIRLGNPNIGDAS